MTNDKNLDALLDAAARRPLTDDETRRRDAHFAKHPAARADWDAELRLRRKLRGLRDAPMPSNFTAQVLARVAAEERAETRAATRGPSLLVRWLIGGGWIRPAVSAALVLALAFAGNAFARSRQRTALARGAAAVSMSAPLADVKLLRDFEPIQRLGAVPSRWVDEELLAALEPGFAR
jgi:anti-sigma factor RsiW